MLAGTRGTWRSFRNMHRTSVDFSHTHSCGHFTVSPSGAGSAAFARRGTNSSSSNIQTNRSITSRLMSFSRHFYSGTLERKTRAVSTPPRGVHRTCVQGTHAGIHARSSINERGKENFHSRRGRLSASETEFDTGNGRRVNPLRDKRRKTKGEPTEKMGSASPRRDRSDRTVPVPAAATLLLRYATPTRAGTPSKEESNVGGDPPRCVLQHHAGVTERLLRGNGTRSAPLIPLLPRRRRRRRTGTPDKTCHETKSTQGYEWIHKRERCGAIDKYPKQRTDGTVSHRAVVDKFSFFRRANVKRWLVIAHSVCDTTARQSRRSVLAAIRTSTVASMWLKFSS